MHAVAALRHDQGAVGCLAEARLLFRGEGGCIVGRQLEGHTLIDRGATNTPQCLSAGHLRQGMKQARQGIVALGVPLAA